MKRILLFGLLGIVFLGTTAFIISSGGIINRTGSPGESTCSACHGGGAGVTQVAISGSPSFIANQYVPGQTYTVTVNVINNPFSLFGFNTEILNSSNNDAGTITSALAGVQVVSSIRTNVTQTTPKSGTGSAPFRFVWVAPLTGSATIYAAGNAVDGTGGTGSDTPGGATLTLTPDLSSGFNEAVSSGISGLNVYPNPVKSEFNISYNLIESATVKASLYDLKGKEIAEISNENQQSGKQFIRGELPEGLAKGVYFVKLSSNEKQQIQRLIIVQ